MEVRDPYPYPAFGSADAVPMVPDRCLPFGFAGELIREFALCEVAFLA